jgi:hypothetical protein
MDELVLDLVGSNMIQGRRLTAIYKPQLRAWRK